MKRLRTVLPALLAVAAAAAAGLATFACSGTTTVEAATSIIVVGHVRDTAGNPISGASVKAIAFTDSCGAGFFAGDVTTTDTAGYYRARPTAIGGDVSTCLVVRVLPQFSSIVDSVAVPGALLLRGTPDSIRVDVTVH